MVYDKALNIYADGSSYSHPRRAAWVSDTSQSILSDEVVRAKRFQVTRALPITTMELLACIKVSKVLSTTPASRSGSVYVFSDSMYVTSNVTRAKFEWSRHRWLNRDGKPVENADLWKELVRVLRNFPKRVDFEWVQGHAKDLHNKAVDSSQSNPRRVF